MSTWIPGELARFGAEDEIRIASLRADGSMRTPVIVWAVRHGDDLYVRSVYGRGSAWFRGTQACHEGRIEVRGLARDVTFEEPDPSDAALGDALDAAYRAKYHRYARSIVDTIVSEVARSATVLIRPRS